MATVAAISPVLSMTQEQLAQIVAMAVSAAAARLTPPPPQELVDKCPACGLSVQAHFTPEGFTCAAGAGHRFSLVAEPIHANANGTGTLVSPEQTIVPAHGDGQATVLPIASSRKFRRAVYLPNTKVPAKNLDLTTARTNILAAIQQEPGITARRLQDVTPHNHGGVQQTLNWLRSHNLVIAKDANEVAATAVSARKGARKGSTVPLTRAAAADKATPSRRRRMSPAARKAVSLRMKRYWRAQRRANAARA